MTAGTAATRATTVLENMIKKGTNVNDEIKTGGGFGRFLTKKAYKIPEGLTTGRYMPKEKALGGMIQKYAAGGAVQSILKTNLVGSATLDSGKKPRPINGFNQRWSS